MSATVYGRKKIRRWERETGLLVVHAVAAGRDGPLLTTVDHRHFSVDEDDRWGEDDWWGATDCGCRRYSCSLLFGLDPDGAPRHFMLGVCKKCCAGPAQPHLRLCPIFLELMDWRSINPDYWPTPVHRPTHLGSYTH